MKLKLWNEKDLKHTKHSWNKTKVYNNFKNACKIKTIIITHLAGDRRFKKMYKEVCQFRLNLLIKISYIPDFENVWSRGSKVMIFLFTSYSHITGNIIGVFEVHFFS